MLANQLALEGATEPVVRRAALQALLGCRDVPRLGGEQIARWIRKHIEYSMEAPGVEVLQGPLHTLSYRVGDCDDLAILWCAMARSVGINARFCGVGEDSDPETMVHAIGYDQDTGLHWELSQDHRWGGARFQPLRFQTPRGYFTLWWSPEPGDPAGFWSAGPAQPYRRTQEPSMIRRRNPAMLSRSYNPSVKTGTGTNTTYDQKSNLYTQGSLGTTGGSDILQDVQAGVGGLASDPGFWGFLTGYRAPAPPTEQLLMESELPAESAPASGGVPPAVWGIIGIAAAAGLTLLVIKSRG